MLRIVGQQCTGLIFAMFTSPKMHLVSLPKFCISIVLSFSFDDCITHKKLKTKFMHNFGGKQGVLWEMFNWWICHLHISHNTAVQGEIEDTAYAKFWWENKAYFGRSPNDEYVLVSIIIMVRIASTETRRSGQLCEKRPNWIYLWSLEQQTYHPSSMGYKRFEIAMLITCESFLLCCPGHEDHACIAVIVIICQVRSPNRWRILSSCIKVKKVHIGENPLRSSRCIIYRIISHYICNRRSEIRLDNLKNYCRSRRMLSDSLILHNSSDYTKAESNRFVIIPSKKCITK